MSSPRLCTRVEQEEKSTHTHTYTKHLIQLKYFKREYVHTEGLDAKVASYDLRTI
jgi:hypothetical protein